MYYQGKLVRSLVKFLAGMSVGEVSNSQAVGGVELAHEELAAGLPDRGHLEDGGGGQQDLHILLAHHQLLLLIVLVTTCNIILKGRAKTKTRKAAYVP